MKVPQRVLWSEGLLVAPQHLQQSDLYHERLLDSRVSAVSPYPWGIVQVDLDPGALGGEQVKLSRFIGVLPDGLFLAFDGGDPECPPVRPLQGKFPPTLPALEVFIGVAKERDGVASVTLDGVPGPRGALPRTRHRVSTRKVTDLAGDGDLEMGFAQRNVVVLLGDEPRDDFDTVKIAEIVRDPAGRLAVNEAYIPPLLRVGGSTFVMEGTRRLLAMMSAKQRQLSDERKQRDAATVEYTANDVTRFLQLSTLNAAIPVLAHVSRAGDISAFDLYLRLLEIAGRLATFSPDEDPTQLPAFVYTDLRSTYEELFARTTAMLRATAREGFFAVPLEVHQGIFVGRLAETHLTGCDRFVLGVKSELPEADVAQRLPAFCKMTSYNQLPHILRAASPGVPLRFAQRPPSEVPVKPGIVYFTLDLSNDFWRHVVTERTVAIYLPPPFDPTRVKLELMGLPKGGGGRS